MSAIEKNPDILPLSRILGGIIPKYASVAAIINDHIVVPTPVYLESIAAK